MLSWKMQFALLPDSEKKTRIERLTEEQAAALLWSWRHWHARPNQILPDGAWVHWLLLAGRGFGKTRTGAEAVKEWAQEKLEAPIHLVAPTAGDIRKVMIEGSSGLLSCYAPGDPNRPTYEPSKGHLLTWPNGNIGYAFSADEPERLRGPQCGRYWADEMAAWRFVEEAWDNLMFGFRLGAQLRGVITTTPKPLRIIRELVRSEATHVTRGSTYDNRASLSPEFFAYVVRKYEGTRIGRQELLAEILDDVPGALWTRDMIQRARILKQDMRWDMIVRVVVAIDPAATSGEDSDETGIIVAALVKSHHVVILDDRTCRESPLGWARAAVEAYNYYKGSRIVAEVNNGGEMVESNLRAVAPNIPFRAVRASRGKTVRAEPVAALYEQGRIHHMGSFPDLEDQLCGYVAGLPGSKSPDRMDALVWAVTELLLDQEQINVNVIRPLAKIGYGP